MDKKWVLPQCVLLWVVFDAVLLIVQRDWHGQLLGLPYRIKFTSWLARLY